MDQENTSKNDNPQSSESTDSKAQGGSAQLKQKIDKIISKGVTEQDVRTADLLHGEIGEGDHPANVEFTLHDSENLPKWLQKFNTWHRRMMSDFVFLLWLAVVVGLFAGLGAHVFNRLITISSSFFLDHIKPDKINWWIILPPIGGIMLAGIYTRYIIHTDLTHGVTRMMHAIYKGRFLFKHNLIYSPIIGGTITLGLGGSAGSEGPIAISGAAIGSNLGRWLQLKIPLVKVLVGCGAAAGISGIFQSPVGGLLFTLEFLKMEIGTLSILAVMLSSLVSYGVVFLCNGCKIPTEFFPDYAIHPSQYWAVILMGVLCGLYSLYYSKVINTSDIICGKMNNPWLRNFVSGLFIGICLLLFPALYGVGYPVMSEIIHTEFTALSNGDVLHGMHLGSWGLIIVAACILILKCWACGICNAGGGVSSDFAPTLYAGAVSGFLFSMFSNTAFDTHFAVPAFALLGMAAVMAGCIEAPMMSIFIVMNMGTDLAFLLAIIIAVYSSYITVRVLSRVRGYDSKLVRHLGWFHNHDFESGGLQSPESSQNPVAAPPSEL